ncbi:hypothetical protein ACN47E_010100 [Coniothyrium glycines]
MLCLLWSIIPVVGTAYSGYTTRSNSLAAVMPEILVVIVCSIQWFILGYTLAYGEGKNIFGDFQYVFHENVLAEPVSTITVVLFSFFQLVFQTNVWAIALGEACERGRLLSLVPFIFLWSPFVYDPSAHMVRGGDFLVELGVLDFADGTPLHINSEATATTMSV